MNDCTVLLFEDGVLPSMRSLGEVIQICLEMGENEPLTFENGWTMGQAHVDVTACILEREELVSLGHPENAAAVVRTGLEVLWLGAVAGAIQEAKILTEVARQWDYDHSTETCDDCEQLYPGWNEVVKLTQPA